VKRGGIKHDRNVEGWLIVNSNENGKEKGKTDF